MKVKYMMGLLMLLFIMLGTAAAADNATCDNLTAVDDEIPLESDVSSDIVDDINVSFKEQMWKEDLGDINVDLPENASGNFAVKINDEVIYNETITNKSFKVPVRLPLIKEPEFFISVYPPIDCKTYKVSAFYNGIDLNITTPLKVMTNPPDYNILYFPDEILQHDTYFRMLVFPRSSNGIVEFYIDDRLFNRTAALPVFYWNSNPFYDLPLGNHTFRVVYYGDSYYLPFEKTFNFTVTNVIISIPKVFNIGHDDCIDVRTSRDVTGTVRVLIDGKSIYSGKTEYGQFYLSMEKYLKYTDSEITVAFTSDGFSRSRTEPINMTYDFDVWPESFVYGEKNIIELTMPDTMNTKFVTVSINGTKYSFKRPDYTGNNLVEIDVSKLGAGNYTMVVSFAGDGKFYPLTKTYNFTVDYRFDVPDFYIDYGSSSKVTLTLPADATGKMVVYVDGKYYSSCNLKKGYGEVKVGSAGLGWHTLLAQYVGDDYTVYNLTSSIYISPKISLTYRFTTGEDKYITVKVPKNCGGYVIFEIDDKPHKVAVKNGVAMFSLKKLKSGEHDIYVDYYGKDGFEDVSNWRVVTISKAKIKFVSAKTSSKGIKVRAKLLTKKGKAMAHKKVTVKFNGKTYKVKTNKKGVLTFKKKMKFYKSKYRVKIIFMGKKLTKWVKVSPSYIKVKKSIRP